MHGILAGMVILMAPAFLICAGVTVLALRRHKNDAGP